MQRTTIMLPVDLKEKVMRLISKTHISLGELIRRLLEEKISETSNRKNLEDSFFSDNAVFKGKTPQDLSTRHDDYLYGEAQ